MQKIEVINGSTIEVDGQKYHKEESINNLLRETNEYFHIGDEVTIKNSGNLCSKHTEGEKYKGWIDGGYPDLTKPLTILVFKRLNYPDACILKQGKGIYIFSGTESFKLYKPRIIPEKKKLPNDKDGIGELIKLYHDQNDGLPFKTPIDEFLENYEE